MDELIAFVRARLDEDEAAAEKAAQRDGDTWQVGLLWDDDDVHVDHGNRHVAGPLSRETGQHIARHDPARVLREVEAKRALLEGHDGVHRCEWGEHRGGEFGPCRQATIIAAVWSDHPDYPR
jgi:hypothetical protein